MNAVKILERKFVIRFFGLALMIAPFINIALMLVMLKNQSHLTWSTLPIKDVLTSGKISNYILILASLIIGLIMLSGSRKAWKYTLILLGIHVLTKIPTIGQDIKQNWFWGVQFLINIALLVFIADQLVFKNNSVSEDPIVNSKLPVTKEPPRYQVKKKTLVSFQDTGAWGELVLISERGFYIRCILAKPPVNIEKRSVELSFQKNLFIRSLFKEMRDQNYYFEFTSLNLEQAQSLQRWLSTKAG